MLLAIDQSLSNFAFCIFNLDGDLIQQENFKPEGVEGKRLKTIQDKLVATYNYYGIKHIAFEGYSYHSGSKNLTKLAELGGIIKCFCATVNKEPIIFSPMSVKKYATGTGKAEKDLILKAVYKRWNFDTDDNNIADAFVIGQLALDIMHLRYYYTAIEDLKEIRTKQQIAVIEKCLQTFIQ